MNDRMNQNQNQSWFKNHQPLITGVVLKPIFKKENNKNQDINFYLRLQFLFGAVKVLFPLLLSEKLHLSTFMLQIKL